MVQLNILTGRKAGTHWVARRFPFQVGRSPNSHLLLDDDGVWNSHFAISLRSGEGAVLLAEQGVLCCVNGEAVQQTALHNGDVIEAGSVKMRFALSPTRQYSLRFREILTWIGLAALCLGQMALIYRLTE